MYKNSAYLKMQRKQKQKETMQTIVGSILFGLTIALGYLLIIAGA